MNVDRSLPSSQVAHPETTREPMDSGTGQADTGPARRSGALLAGEGEALADEEARRICIRQLSTAELNHEEEVIAKHLAMLHGLLADIRRERKYRKSLRG